MNIVFAEYPVIDGVNSDNGSLKVLIAPTSEDDTKVRFNIAQMVGDICKANVCALITKETAELFVHHLISQCAAELPKCGECGCECKIL